MQLSKDHRKQLWMIITLQINKTSITYQHPKPRAFSFVLQSTQ